VNIFTFPEFRKRGRFVLIEFQTATLFFFGSRTFVIEDPRPTRGRIAYSPSLNSSTAKNVIAGIDCSLVGRVHPQIAWAKLRALREGAAIANKKLWS
jgi:hypothetical protein